MWRGCTRFSLSYHESLDFDDSWCGGCRGRVVLSAHNVSDCSGLWPAMRVCLLVIFFVMGNWKHGVHYTQSRYGVCCKENGLIYQSFSGRHAHASGPTKYGTSHEHCVVVDLKHTHRNRTRIRIGNSNAKRCVLLCTRPERYLNYSLILFYSLIRTVIHTQQH